MAQSVPMLSETSELAGKYLTFQLGDEIFGLEILKVREIIGLMDITQVPRTPDNIRGVINLRGKIIPVVDLRVKFGMNAAPDTEQTCIIVVEAQVGGETIQSGILVDAVSEVLNIPADAIEPAPSFGAGVDAGFIRAMAKCQNQVTILLEVQSVLDQRDLEDAAGTEQES